MKLSKIIASLLKSDKAEPLVDSLVLAEARIAELESELKSVQAKPGHILDVLVCHFPKHRGTKWSAVVEHDKAYVKWLLRTDRVYIAPALEQALEQSITKKAEKKVCTLNSKQKLDRGNLLHQAFVDSKSTYDSNKGNYYLEGRPTLAMRQKLNRESTCLAHMLHCHVKQLCKVFDYYLVLDVTTRYVLVEVRYADGHLEEVRYNYRTKVEANKTHLTQNWSDLNGNN